MDNKELQDLLSQGGLSYDPNANTTQDPALPPPGRPSLASQLSNAGIQGVPTPPVQTNASPPPAIVPRGNVPTYGPDVDYSGIQPMSDAQARRAGFNNQVTNVNPQNTGFVPATLADIAASRAADKKVEIAKAAKSGAPTKSIWDAYRKAQGAEATQIDAQAAAAAGVDAAAAKAAQNKADFLKFSSADSLAQARQHDEVIGRHLDQLDSLSRDAASKKIDPDRWYRNMSTGQSLLWTLAAAAGGAAQGWTHGAVGNSALDAMKQHVDNDINAQKQDIESAHGRVEDQKGILGETYKRFGNMDTAVSAARVLSLQKLDQDASAQEANADSPVQKAKFGALKSQLQTSIEKEKAEFAYKAQQAGAATAKQKEQMIGQKALELVEKAAANGTNLTIAQAREQVAQAFGSGTSGDTGPGFAKPQKGAAGDPKVKAQVDNIDEAIAHFENIHKMINEGGELSPSRTAKGQAERTQALHALARVETGGNRPPSPEEQKLLETQIPDDPNAYHLTGADKTKTETTLQSLRERRARLLGLDTEDSGTDQGLAKKDYGTVAAR